MKGCEFKFSLGACHNRKKKLTLLPTALLWRCTSALDTSSSSVLSLSNSLESRKFWANVIPYETLSLHEPHFQPCTVTRPFLDVSHPHSLPRSPLEQAEVIW